MSEQTPESTAKTTDEGGFAAAESEPSMEDILASIRKIISDDADPVPLDGPGDVQIEDAADAVTSTDDTFDLDSLLGELEGVAPTAPLPTSLADAVGLSDLTSLEDDLAIPDVEEVTADLEVVAVDQNEDDMDRLMSELLNDMEVPAAAPNLDDPVAAAITPQASSDDDDMDIVKSLMADLTDDDVEPSADETLADEMDFDAMMDEIADFDPAPEVEAEVEADTSSEVDDLEADELDAMEDDIFDSILEMTLDDEVEAFDAQSESDPSVPSLADIAAAADAEAIVEAAAMVKSASVLGADNTKAENAQSDTEEPAAEIAEASVEPQPAKPAPSEMEIPMPSALRSDAILDDVTEQATMSAFAELNQVVEDKAVLSERGPRVGDLVQDALKPMLKEWLDENIQGIVERAVAKEVSRIATGK